MDILMTFKRAISLQEEEMSDSDEQSAEVEDK